MPQRLTGLREISRALVLLLSLSGMARAETPNAALTPEQRNYFEKEVRPLLIKRCFECHGGTKAAGGLSLATAKGWKAGGESGPAIVPGHPDESLFIEAINYGSMAMPPRDKGGKLPEHEIRILTAWVQMGAPDPRDGSDVIGGMSREEASHWWAFQPLPATGEADQRSIDRGIEREWTSRGLSPAPPADKRTLLRRATYDLTGLPPTPAETADFLADDSPDAFQRVIERLLASPQYGVQWGRHWLDVVRYADTAGENTDRPLPHAWRYRNWVIDSIQRDMPFDEFVRMQIAGDLITRGEPWPRQAEGIVATGYLAIARRFGHDIDKDMYLTHEDVIDNLGKNFLGLSLGCARCHDHKYDPINAEDYYALYGIFDSTRFSFPGCEPKGQPRDLVPLLPQNEIDALLAPWRERQERSKAAAQRRVELARTVFPPESLPSTRLIQKSVVPEGASVAIESSTTNVKRGEILLLTVEPGGNHGADSTLAELSIRDTANPAREWTTRDIVPTLTTSNPLLLRDASWCFVELTKDGPVFLTEKGDSINGNPMLRKWGLGDTPSVFVNASDQPVSVWTTLSARSFFVHPGPGRPVAVAWISPMEGEVVVQGQVADAHPAALDGVSFRLEHIAHPPSGAALAEIGKSLGDSAPLDEPAPVVPVAFSAVDRDGRNAKFQERGDPEKPGKEIPRRWLAAFGGDTLREEKESGRRELADWITRHPLTARVMVNRIWGWHFGRGLVASSNDFGTRGEKPTHPALLDELAGEFARTGYSLKAMHRRIMRTDAYQRASATPLATDPENRWLSHVSRRRLTAEELRDSLLVVSGQIDLSPGEGHPFPAEATWTYTQHTPFNAVYDTPRRSAFLMVQRQRRHPFLALFDGADPNASTPLRQTTTVPTQALYFMNDPFFHAQAGFLAHRIQPLANDSLRTDALFNILFQRPPAGNERNRVSAFLGSYTGSPEDKWSALGRVLLASNEFLHVE